MERQYVDLHIHTQCSDGTDSIDEIFEKLKNNSIGIFSVTDHDTVDFYSSFDENKLAGVKLIPGVEFSCNVNGKRCHILGYGINTENKNLEKIIDKIKALRKSRFYKRLESLKDDFGIVLTDDEMAYLNSIDVVGKPHISHILIKRGLAQTVTEAMKKYLSKPLNGNDSVDDKCVIDVIKDAGGIPVWAHPLGGEDEKHLNEDDFTKRLEVLVAHGIKGMECFYSRYSQEEIDFLLEYAENYSLLVSGGSDYHGKLKNVEIGTLGVCEDCLKHCTEDNLSILGEICCL